MLNQTVHDAGKQEPVWGGLRELVPQNDTRGIKPYPTMLFP